MGTFINPYRFATVAPAFVPLDLGAKLIAWWDPSDLTTLDKSGPVPVTTDGDAVLNMRDKSGNGWNVQATSASRPLWKIDGSGNKYLLFDGSNDFFYWTSFAMALPWERITALQQITWVSGDYIWGTTISSGRPGAVLPIGVTPEIRMTDGSGVISTTDLTVGANHVLTERHVSGASQIAVDNIAYTTGNVGSTNASDMILGAGSAIGSLASNIRFYGGVVCNGTLTAGEIASLRTYLGNKCGLTL